MLLDANTQYLQLPRQYIFSPLSVLHDISNAPVYLVQGIGRYFQSNLDLLEENKQLKLAIIQSKAQVQQYDHLHQENKELRMLLNSKALLNKSLLITELSGLVPSKSGQRIIINRGLEEGVYIGQAVIDAKALIGQVVNTSSYKSEVLLISDASHALSVQSVKNATKGILAGQNDLHSLSMLYVPKTEKIEVGDLLVTSGLDERFPKGYPVAAVSEVSADPANHFLEITAVPLAKLNTLDYLLLVFEEDSNSKGNP